MNKPPPLNLLLILIAFSRQLVSSDLPPRYRLAVRQ